MKINLNIFISKIFKFLNYFSIVRKNLLTFASLICLDFKIFKIL